MRLVCGNSNVIIPTVTESVSELLSFLDPEEDVPLPGFVETRLHSIPSILEYILNNEAVLRTASTEGLARMCTECIPNVTLKEALTLLDVLDFLDIRPGVNMALCYIKTVLARAPTVDDILDAVYEPGEFELLPVEAQRVEYETLLSRLNTDAAI